ncbi:hypothetical protein C5167_036338 [Papaver somniferum]|uniref:Mediator of RNA polymerase II transcription subunit 4 n=2 Tax=Papaver somniferum TaxID=3469 RepID=A0A4Y7I6Q9_PAPSO|nr:hypothetical protein C5167_036338 [Papaver somniferum]
MASLTSKLFEVSPNLASWFTSFRGSVPSFLASQTLTLPPLETSPTSPKEIISLFTCLQTQLFESLAELQEILHLQEAKQKITLEIKTKDAAILAFGKKLKEAEHVLDLLVDDYSDYHRPKRSKTEGHRNSDDTEMSCIPTSLKLNDILSYAHHISYTTFAPPEFGAGKAPLRGALPPALQEEQMRASQLYNFADLDIGLPKIQINEKNKLGDLAAVEGLVPPQLTVPSGERPGMMPVELPTDFQVMQPDVLKLGNPVPLPALDDFVRGKVEAQQPHSLPVQSLEPRQVPFVQLDIDQGDSSSEYSSEGSSEED